MRKVGYQYLASLGIITLFSAGAALLIRRAEGWGRAMGQMGCVALVAVLAVLSWRQSRMYADIETLYETTIERDPDCWMAHYNLGLALAVRGEVDKAIAHYQRAVEIKPGLAEAHTNLGVALAGCGEVGEAIAHYRKALEIKPGDVKAHYNLAITLADRGKRAEALEHYQKALDLARARNNKALAEAIRAQIMLLPPAAPAGNTP